MSDESRSVLHTIQGTIPPDEWMKFFKQHFKPSPPGSREPLEAAPKTTGSCEDYGCPTNHPISGTKLTGCDVQIVRGRVVTVSCHYEEIAR